MNSEPTVGVGLPADDVAFDLVLPANLTIGDVAIEQGSCTRDDLILACEIGTLDAGAEVNLTMTATGPGNLIYDASRDFEGALRTSSDALDQDVGMYASVHLIADMTDSDGDGMSDTFENTYGLNPGIDDSASDADGDGLSNVDE